MLGIKRFNTAAIFIPFFFAGLCLADIVNWKTGQVISGTEGITPGPGINLSYWKTETHNLCYGAMNQYDLSGTDFSFSWMNHALFNGSNLSNSSFKSADITNATFDGAIISNADFSKSNITASQFYSTYSYQVKDIHSVGLADMDLSGGDFTGQNMTGANISRSIIYKTIFEGANLRNANLRGAQLYNNSGINALICNLNNADLTDAEIQYAFIGRALTQSQLYSTRSYKERDLQGINLKIWESAEYPAWNFEGQNLSYSSLEINSIYGANKYPSFRGANLINATFLNDTLVGIDFTDAAINGVKATTSSLPHITKEQLLSTKSYKTKDLSYFYLSVKDLTGIDLSGFNLRRSKMAELITNANLTDADISGADFSGATNLTALQFYSTINYKNKDLRGVGLGSLSLVEGNFNKQNLCGASFYNSYLYRADLTDATINSTNFGLINRQDGNYSADHIYTTKSYKNKDLRGIQFGTHNDDFIAYGRRSIPGLNLSNQDLTGADFKNIFSEMNMQNAILRHANFYNFTGGINLSNTTSGGFTLDQLKSIGTVESSPIILLYNPTRSKYSLILKYNDFSGWDLSEQTMMSCTFSDSNLSGVNFKNAKLNSSVFQRTDLSNVNFEKSDITGCVLTDAIITGATFKGTLGITVDQFVSTKSFKDKNLQCVNISGYNLTNFNFAGFNLSNADLSNCTFTNAILENAVINGTDLSGAIAKGLTGIMFYSTRSYQDKNLSGVKLRNNVMAGADFSWQNLTDADFSGSTLTGCNFTNAVIRGADFSDTTSHGFSVAMLYSTKSYQDKDMQNIKLRNNGMAGGDFSCQNLTGADFSNSILTDALFTDAVILYMDFYNVKGFTKEQFMSTASFKQRDLRGVGLSLKDMSSFDMSEFNLSETNFVNAKIAGANLTGAIINKTNFRQTDLTSEQFASTHNFATGQLQGIILSKCNLENFNFTGKNLSGADFSGSSMLNADFTNADISRVNFSESGLTANQLYSTKNYKNKNLRGMNFSKKSLEGGDFHSQNMAETDLSFCNLNNADFSGATLNHADCRSVSMNGTNMKDAIVRGTDFSNSQLSREQLYSTGSYKNQDLRGIKLNYVSFGSMWDGSDSWDFSCQSLLDSELIGVSSGSRTSWWASDLRGAKGILVSNQWLNPALNPTAFTNAIMPDGSLENFVLYSGSARTIFGHYLAVHVYKKMEIQSDATLRLMLSEDWTAPIIVHGFSPDLRGILDLRFDEGIDISAMLGKTFDLFDWNGTLLDDSRFSQIITNGYHWDLGSLYTTGEITLIPEPTTLFLISAGIFLLRFLGYVKGDRNQIRHYSG